MEVKKMQFSGICLEAFRLFNLLTKVISGFEVSRLSDFQVSIFQVFILKDNP